MSKKNVLSSTLVASLITCSVFAQNQYVDVDLSEHVNQTSNEIHLPLSVLKREVIRMNGEIRSQRLQADIAKEDIVYAQGAFQPQLTLDITKSSSDTKNTAEEALLRSGLGTYETDSRDLALGYSQLLPTGATLEATASLSGFDSNVSRQRRGFAQDDYRSLYNISITQPLLRGAGYKMTGAQVEIAKLNAQVGKSEIQQTSTAILADAMATYYDLALAQDRLSMWIKGELMTKNLLKDAKGLLSSGRLSDTDVLDVKSSLLRYQAGHAEAKQAVLVQINRLRSFLASPATNSKMQGMVINGLPDALIPELTFVTDRRMKLVASDGLPRVSMPELSLEKSLTLALKHRSDFKMQTIKAEREGIQVSYAKDQARVKLDFIASYGLNNLESDAGRSLTRYDESTKYASWDVGFQASMPLGKDKKAGALLRSAKLRRQDALLNLHMVKNVISNDIDTSINAIQTSYAGWKLFDNAVNIEQQQLKTERQRLKSGRSDVRSVLAREERLINARNAQMEQALTFAKALISLEVAQGTLLN